jgi:hypothetical protein
MNSRLLLIVGISLVAVMLLALGAVMLAAGRSDAKVKLAAAESK